MPARKLLQGHIQLQGGVLIFPNQPCKNACGIVAYPPTCLQKASAEKLYPIQINYGPRWSRKCSYQSPMTDKSAVYPLGGPPPCHTGIIGIEEDPNTILSITYSHYYWVVGPPNSNPKPEPEPNASILNPGLTSETKPTRMEVQG